MRKVWLMVIALSVLSCGTESESDQLALEAALEKKNPQNTIADETIAGIINSIPSPLEISELIKKSGGMYEKSLLNDPEKSSDYNTGFKKAINLGVYSTDLGYINIYGRNADALDYISSVKELADGLNIGHFFDLAMIKKLAENRNDMDSLLLVTTDNFEKINRFLQENRRSEQSVLILSGGWLEATYLSCEIVKKNPNEKLKEKIAEQKIILEQLLLLLSNYSDDQDVAILTGELKKLKEVFDQIEISYVYKKSKMKEVDGILVIEDESQSQVNITEENLADISKITEEIRNKII